MFMENESDPAATSSPLLIFNSNNMLNLNHVDKDLVVTLRVVSQINLSFNN